MAVSNWPGLGCQSAWDPLDVIGDNEYFGWFDAGGGGDDDRDALSPFLDTVRACYPTKAIMVTEFGFDGNRDGPVEERGTYAFQANSVAFHLNVFATKPWLSGAMYFALQDYVAFPTVLGRRSAPRSAVQPEGAGRLLRQREAGVGGGVADLPLDPADRPVAVLWAACGGVPGARPPGVRARRWIATATTGDPRSRRRTPASPLDRRRGRAGAARRPERGSGPHRRGCTSLHVTVSSTTELRRTPLYDRHAAAGARLVPFAGWEMPVQYAGIREEHIAVRTGVGVFDVSHMGQVETTRPAGAGRSSSGCSPTTCAGSPRAAPSTA